MIANSDGLDVFFQTDLHCIMVKAIAFLFTKTILEGYMEHDFHPDYSGSDPKRNGTDVSARFHGLRTQAKAYPDYLESGRCLDRQLLKRE